MADKSTRPALVIGVGGTGQWILTFLKKDLLEYNQGVMPKNVKLLAFDTVAQPQAREKGARGGEDEKDIRIGGVELRINDEFIHLGKENPDIFHWAEGIVNENKHPHIAPWFQAKEYLRSLSKDAFNLSAGAGQIRQFGRMAIINDLAQPTNSEIWSRIQQELKKISGAVAANNQLEVIIAGSFAGGTGAGMFIDMAVLLRQIALLELQDETKFIVRGLFVLPSAFGLSGKDYEKLEMQARAFAAWRELDRFMIKSPTFGLRSIQYHQSHQTLRQVEMRTRPFDACYLVDSHRPNNSLDVVEPEEGIFPSVADVISAILDPSAGKHYTEHITKNLNPIYVQHPDTPMYSAVGSYTLKVPIYYTLEEIVHLFAIDALDTWLEPLKDSRERITKLASDKNEELGIGKAGLEEAIPFLRRTRVSRGEQGITATTFFKHFSDIVEMEEIQRGRLETTYSLPKAPQNHLLLLTHVGDSNRANELRNQIDGILNQRLAQQVPLSREIKEDPKDGIGRIEKKASQFLQDRFGRRLEDGTEIRGEYGEALAQCRHFQSITFRSMLAMYIHNLLMGEAESDPMRARRGKLGYAHDLVRELVNVFDTYISFLGSVDDKRQEGGRTQDVYKRYDEKQMVMRDTAGSKILFGALTAPKAHRTQEDFIKAGQDLADMRRDDLLLLAARETVEDMRSAAIELRDSLHEWIVTLAIGTEENSSLYQRVSNNLGYLRQGKDRDAALSRVQKMIGTEAEEDLYVQDIEAMNNILERIEWNIFDDVEKRANEEVRKFVVECTFRKGEEALSMQSNNIRNIMIEWLANCREEYRYIPSQKRIGDVLVEEYGPQGSKQLAQEINDKAGPLWQPATGQEGPKTKHSFIRVFHDVENSDEEDAASQLSGDAVRFLGDLKNQLGQLNASSNLAVEMVNSADHYKLSIIQSDDCIPSDNFKVWETLRKAYISHIQRDPDKERQERAAILLHAFPAECNVAEFEARWAAENNSYEVFEPDVVMVVTKKPEAKLFFLAYGAGIIKAEKDVRAIVLAPPGQELIFLNAGKDGQSKRDTDDIFATMDAFVNHGQDVRIDRTTPIPYDSLRPHIVKGAEEKFGSYLEFLEHQKQGGEGTIYWRLMEKYNKSTQEKYLQLARICRFMFEDEIEEEKQWAEVE